MKKTLIFKTLFSCYPDVKQKLDELVQLYEDIKSSTANRNQDLEDTLEVSEKFWEDLNTLSNTVKELQDQITNQEPPALEPAIIREQQDLLEVGIFSWLCQEKMHCKTLTIRVTFYSWGHNPIYIFMRHYFCNLYCLVL